ncbi:MAG: rane protein [Proteobacteria bacterium]|nr:rane protein [Pseudomonadota bacterium]
MQAFLTFIAIIFMIVLFVLVLIALSNSSGYAREIASLRQAVPGMIRNILSGLGFTAESRENVRNNLEALSRRITSLEKAQDLADLTKKIEALEKKLNEAIAAGLQIPAALEEESAQVREALAALAEESAPDSVLTQASGLQQEVAESQMAEKAVELVVESPLPVQEPAAEAAKVPPAKFKPFTFAIDDDFAPTVPAAALAADHLPKSDKIEITFAPEDIVVAPASAEIAKPPPVETPVEQVLPSKTLSEPEVLPAGKPVSRPFSSAIDQNFAEPVRVPESAPKAAEPAPAMQTPEVPLPPPVIPPPALRVAHQSPPMRSATVQTPPLPSQPPRAPVRPMAPQEPGLIENAVIAAKNWFFGGNTLVRIGMVLVFLGLTFLLRYASPYIVIPLWVRYLGVALTALLALVLGWRLRLKRPDFGLLMQGGAVAVMYLTVYAALKLHGQPLIPMYPAFALLVAVAALATFLAISQNALSMAVAGSLGGFAAPVLVSTGGGNHVALFSYFALLNAGIMATAWFKTWRPLNLIGFFGTFSIGLAWGLSSYNATQHYASMQPFLILFFLMFVVIGLLFARRKLMEDENTPETRDIAAWRQWLQQQGHTAQRYVDGTLLFGTPLVGFGLQHALVKHIEYGTAFSSLALGAFYLLLARLLYGRNPMRCRLLVEVFLALGMIFATLAIPLGLDAHWTSAAWAVEGAGIYWIGHRQQRPLARIFALLLQAGATYAFLTQLSAGHETLLSGSVMGALMLGLALLCDLVVLKYYRTEDDLWDDASVPALAFVGLWSLFLIPPMLFLQSGTVAGWTVAGLIALIVAMRWRFSWWIGHALLVQLAALVMMITTLGFGKETLLAGDYKVALLVGLVLLTDTFMMHFFQRDDEEARMRYSGFPPLLTSLGLWSLFLIAPLLFHTPGTVTSWVIAGLVAVIIAMRCCFNYWVSNALLVQLGALALFLTTLATGQGTLLAGDYRLALLLGFGILADSFLLRLFQRDVEENEQRYSALQPMLATLGLWSLFLVSPLLFDKTYTVSGWAVCGLVAVGIALRWRLSYWVSNGLLVQFFAAALFLTTLRFGGNETLMTGEAPNALLLGLVLLTDTFMLRYFQRGIEEDQQRYSGLQPFLATLGLWSLLLIAPLFCLREGTTVAWAVGGFLALFVALKWRFAYWRTNILLAQFLAIVMFVSTLKLGQEAVFTGNAGISLLLGVVLLVQMLLMLHYRKEAGEQVGMQMSLSTPGLWLLYLIAPITLQMDNMTAAWAIAGAVTAFVGLRFRLRGWMGNALLVQLLAGLLFLAHMKGAEGTGGVLAFGGSGIRGLVMAMLIGVAMMASVLAVVREARASSNPELARGFSWVMLIGLSFVVLGVLFVLPWATATAVWAICGLLLMWAAMTLRLKPVLWFAIALEVVAGFAFFRTTIPDLVTSAIAFAGDASAFGHSGFWTPAVLALAALAVAWRLHNYARTATPEEAEDLGIDGDVLSLPALLWFALWWGFGWYAELSRISPTPQDLYHYFLAAMSATALLLLPLVCRYDWRRPAILSLVVLPITVQAVIYDYLHDRHPFSASGWFAFGLSLAAHLGLLRILRGRISEAAEKGLHLVSCWIWLAVAAFEMRHLFLELGDVGSVWRWLGWVMPLAAWLLWSARRNLPTLWPFGLFPLLYRFTATLPVVVILLGWMFLANFKSSGNPAPLGYLPLINPLELALGLVLFSTWFWRKRLAGEDEAAISWQWLHAPLKWLLFAGLFLIYTFTVLRGVHHFGHCPFDSQGFTMPVAQSALSIAWGLYALILMIVGNRKGRRSVWIIGVVLVGIVVAKLFFIDLSNRDSLERIISFIGVGLLLLIVGYFAPLPPKRQDDDQS